MTYSYSVMRFVPDPARGEFVNIGAVAGEDESRDWDFRLISNLSRAKAIDDRAGLGAALAFVDEVVGRVDALERLPGFAVTPMSLELLRLWAHEMRNVVQWTWPTPVVADSASDALEKVFEELLVDPAHRRFPFHKKHRAVRAVAEAYQSAGIPESAVARNVLARTEDYSDRFDFAVHNGSVVQLVKCWSFQLPSQAELAEEVKAWAWVARHLRESGGTVDTQAGGLEVRPRADLAVVYVPPLSNGPAAAFEEARAAFREIDVTARPAEEADVVGQHVLQLLAMH